MAGLQRRASWALGERRRSGRARRRRARLACPLGEGQRQRRAHAEIDVNPGLLEEVLRQLTMQSHPVHGDLGLGPGIPNPLSGLSPPYAKPEAWLPIASRSTTTLATPAFAR